MSDSMSLILAKAEAKLRETEVLLATQRGLNEAAKALMEVCQACIKNPKTPTSDTAKKVLAVVTSLNEIGRKINDLANQKVSEAQAVASHFDHEVGKLEGEGEEWKDSP